jgi:hypothetical protein
MALTAALESLRPKKNMAAAPAAGSTGIIQMWSRKNMWFWLLATSFWLLALGLSLFAVSYQLSAFSNWHLAISI